MLSRRKQKEIPPLRLQGLQKIPLEDTSMVSLQQTMRWRKDAPPSVNISLVVLRSTAPMGVI